ncbi:hypothetical protein AAF712_006198, partial [Marasmius tenuissimus]
YANSLMCTLNARSYIRNSGDDCNSTSRMFGSHDMPTMGTALPTRIAGGISIHVDTMHKYDNDRDLEKGGQEQVEMSPVGKSKPGRDDRSSDEIEHGNGVSFCEMEDSEDIREGIDNSATSAVLSSSRARYYGVIGDGFSVLLFSPLISPRIPTSRASLL